MFLSVVSTMYHSGAYLEAFCARASAAAREAASDYEIVLVNDGSPDDSLAVALRLQRENPRIRIVDLSRNFGHHKAMMTGLAHARGDWVFLIDCDLEESPEWLGRFQQAVEETGADVAFGVQEKRKGGLGERVLGKIFYKVFNWISTQPIPEDQVTARLMSRRYVDALLRHRERELVMVGLWAATGFRQTPVAVRKESKGSTVYTLPRKVAIFVNAITSYSGKPLELAFYLGLLIMTVSTAAGAWLVIRKLFFGHMLDGWASLIVSIWLLGGLTIFCLGLIGIYLSKVFIEVKQRPYSIVREVFEAEASGAAGEERVCRIDAALDGPGGMAAPHRGSFRRCDAPATEEDHWR